MVARIIGNDSCPVFSIIVRFILKPRSMTAYCNILFDVNPIPALYVSLFGKKLVRIIPKSMPKTGPPMTGIKLPKNQDGSAIRTQMINPFQESLIVCIILVVFPFRGLVECV